MEAENGGTYVYFKCFIYAERVIREEITAVLVFLVRVGLL